MKSHIAFIALSMPLLASTTGSKILSIYPNASFLSYEYKVKSGEFTAKIPDFVNLKNLSLQSGCSVEKTSITKLKKNRKNLEKLEDLRQRYTTVNAKNELLKSIKLNPNSLRKSVKEFGKVYLANLKEMASINEQISKLIKVDKKRLQNQFRATLICSHEDSLKLTFPLQGIKSEKITSFYARSQKNELKITQKLFLTHSLGELLKNVDLRLYSFAYDNALTPMPFYPEYLQQRRRMVKKAMYSDDMVVNSAPMMEKSVSTRKSGVQNNLTTKRVWDVKNLSLEHKKENEIVFSTQSVKAKYQNYIDGYGSVMAYMKGSFKPKSYVSGGTAQFVLDGAMIGKRYLHELIANEEANVYFGQNRLLQIQKDLAKKMRDESFFGTSQNTKILWKYTIANKSKKVQKISFHERLPISQDSEIKVKQIGDFKADYTAKNGEVKWDFSLNTDEKKSFTFGYEIEKPTK